MIPQGTAVREAVLRQLAAMSLQLWMVQVPFEALCAGRTFLRRQPVLTPLLAVYQPLGPRLQPPNAPAIRDKWGLLVWNAGTSWLGVEWIYFPHGAERCTSTYAAI